MSFRWLWDMCDVSYELVTGGLPAEKAERLDVLYALLAQDVEAAGNGVSTDLLVSFISLACEISVTSAVNPRLVSAFYDIGLVVRSALRAYCEDEGFDYRDLINGPRGDANFKHGALPYKEG